MKKLHLPLSLLLCAILLCSSPFVCFTAEVLDEDDPEVFNMYGDVDGDHDVTAADARLVLNAAVDEDLITENTLRFYAADADLDEKLTALDARMILRAAVKLDKLCTGRLHRHLWSEQTVLNNPTCIATGKAKRICILDRTHVIYDTLPYGPHKLTKITQSLIEGEVIWRAPFYQCSVCGQRFANEAGTQALQPEKYIKEPTLVSGALKTQCDSICRSFNATGVQVAIVKDGYVYQTYSYGTADKSTGRKVNADTKYRAASLSKIATTCVFMALCDRGLVSETADISTYFGYKCYNPYYPNVTITPRLILTHSAAFIGDAGRVLQPGALSNRAYYYNTKPGTAEQYSNFGFNVLACICERVTGMSLNQLAKKYVFEPLGIDASFLAYQLKDTSNLGGLYGPEGNLTPAGMLSVRPLALGTGLTLAAGNLTISAKDYAKILAMIMNDGVAENGTRVLSKQSVEAMKTVRLNCAHYGLGYAMRRETTVFPGKVVYAHSGSAFGMFGGYVFCPAEKAAVVVFTSGCSRSRVASTQLYTICHRLIQAAYPS